MKENIQQSFHGEKVAVYFHNIIHMISEHISIYRYKTVKAKTFIYCQLQEFYTYH